MENILSGINWYSIIVTVLLVVLGYVVSFVKKRSDLVQKAEEYINVAEENYKNYTSAGSQKLAFVVDTLYNYTPAPLRIFITRQMISDLVQTAFNKMAEFADKQLDKVVDNIMNKEAEPEDNKGAEDA